MIDYDPHHWWQHLFDVKGTMVQQIMYRVMAVVIWSALVVLLDRHVTDVHQPALVHSLVGLALGLLLVFRTNASYDRFWEGRKQWGAIVNESRNLARQARVLLAAEPELYQMLIRWAIVFPYTCMHRLRSAPALIADTGELPPDRVEAVMNAQHVPLAIGLEMTRIIDTARRRGLISDYQQDMLDRNVQQLIDYIGACERIHKTPLPFAYVVHLRRAMLLYCFTLPLALVNDFHWWSVPANFFVAYTFFGIEEIGVQIEDPFGTDDNDLPLDAICSTIDANLRALLH